MVAVCRVIPGVMRDGDFSPCLRMAPDLMTAGALTVELKAESTKAAHNFAVRKSTYASHHEPATGTRNSRLARRLLRNTSGSGSPCSRQDSTILRATPCAISTVSEML